MEDETLQTEKPSVEPIASDLRQQREPSNRYAKKSDVVVAEQLTAERLAAEFPNGVATQKGLEAAVDGDWLITRERTIKEHKSDALGANAEIVESTVPVYEIVSDEEFKRVYEPADA